MPFDFQHTLEERMRARQAEAVAVLRSGRYRQNDGVLFMSDGSGGVMHCAVGALAAERGLTHLTFGPGDVPKVDGWYCIFGCRAQIMKMNDRGHTFEQIADWLEGAIERMWEERDPIGSMRVLFPWVEAELMAELV